MRTPDPTLTSADAPLPNGVTEIDLKPPPMRHRLPAREERYSLKELLDIAERNWRGDLPLDKRPYYIREAYERSHEVALALQQLQKVVEKTLKDEPQPGPDYERRLEAYQKTRKRLLADSDEDHTKIIRQEIGNLELGDLSEERGKIHYGSSHSWAPPEGDLYYNRMNRLRDAANDPLAQARKHVVDLMVPKDNPMWEEGGILPKRRVYLGCERNEAERVHDLMMLMAENTFLKERSISLGTSF